MSELHRSTSRVVHHLVIATVLCTVACAEEANRAAPATSSSALEGGRDHLTFADEDEFHSVMDSLVNQDADVLDAFQAQLGFQSLRNAYDREDAAAEMYVEPGEPVVESIALSTVLSPSGVVVIGTTKWRVDRTGVWRTEGDRDEERVSDVRADTYEGDPERGSCPSGTGCYPSEECTSVYSVGGLGGDWYRLRARYYTTNLFFYAEAGVSVRHQKRHSFLGLFYWWSNYPVSSVKGSGLACAGLGLWFPPLPPSPLPGAPYLWTVSTGFSTGFNHVFWSGPVFNMRACFWASDGQFSSTAVVPGLTPSCTL